MWLQCISRMLPRNLWTVEILEAPWLLKFCQRSILNLTKERVEVLSDNNLRIRFFFSPLKLSLQWQIGPRGKDDGNRKLLETEDAEILSTADIQSLRFTHSSTAGFKVHRAYFWHKKKSLVGQKQGNFSFRGRMVILIFERDKGN